MTLYSAEMKHSSDSVKRFTVIQYDTFEPLQKIIRIVLALALIVVGALSGSSAAMILLLFLGCILLTNLNTKAASIADEVKRALHGKFPELTYSFSEIGFLDGPERPETPYTSLIRLIEDNEYYYLFVSKASGYMIEINSVAGEGGSEGLKRLLSEKSGCEWTKPVTIATLRLKDIIRKK